MRRLLGWQNQRRFLFWGSQVWGTVARAGPGVWVGLWNAMESLGGANGIRGSRLHLAPRVGCGARRSITDHLPSIPSLESSALFVG